MPSVVLLEIPLLVRKADELCHQGIIDSSEYLKLALADLNSFQITHVAIALECLRPKIDPKVQKMRASIAQLLNIGIDCVGITATSGEGLTDFGRGEGIFCQSDCYRSEGFERLVF